MAVSHLQGIPRDRKCKDMSFDGCVEVTDLYLNCISVGLEPFIAMGKKVQTLVLRRAPLINDY